MVFLIKKVFPITVHLLTASGVVFGFWAMVLILQGDAANAFRLLALAAVIDSVDGTLARWTDVKRITPEIDGALIDNLVDYLTWVFIPLIWAWSFLDIPFLVSATAILSSVIGFAHIHAKTDDHFFRGFPSCWNLVVLYLYISGVGVLISSMIILGLAILVQIPVKFVYPSRTPEFKKLTISLSIPYILMLGVILYLFETTPAWLIGLSLYYPLYYIAISGYLMRVKSGI